MPTPIQFPDGEYDATHLWQNANDRVSYQRAFAQSPGEQRKIAQALACASPDTPEDLITLNMTVPGVPPRFGYDTEQLTVSDMFNRNLGHVNDFPPSDFSGMQGQFSGTSTPATPAW